MNSDTLFFDLETQREAAEVGGWHNKHLMRMSVGVTYGEKDKAFMVFYEADVQSLIDALSKSALVIGFNIQNFDYAVLSGYSKCDFSRIPTFDILRYVESKLGHRLSLETIARATLGTSKLGDGLAAIRWFRSGELDKIVEYCKEDVRITRDIYYYGKEHGSIFFDDRSGMRRSLAVNW